MHKFIFSAYRILYEFICGYDVKANYNRELKLDDKQDFQKFLEEVCENYSTLKFINVLYFTLLFVMHIIIFVYGMDYVSIALFNSFSIFVIIAFMNIFVEASGFANSICFINKCLMDLSDKNLLSNNIPPNRNSDSQIVGKIVFKAIGAINNEVLLSKKEDDQIDKESGNEASLFK